ncbi:TPA: polysaccharide biosynthesis tyrosine autokinase [Klebsiella pneumoniae]
MTDKLNSMSTGSQESDGIDLGRLIGEVIDHKGLIISVTFFFMGLGFLYAFLAPPVYEADSLVQVEQNAGNNFLSSLSDVLPTTPPQLAAEIELIKSRMVLGKTINDLNLSVVIEEKTTPIIGQFLKKIRGDDGSKINVKYFNVPHDALDTKFTIKITGKDSYTINLDDAGELKGQVNEPVSKNGFEILLTQIESPPGTEFSIKRKDTLQVLSDLNDAFTVADTGKDTGVLSLSLTGNDPEKIKTILQSITDNYLLQNIERKSEEAAKSLNFLDRKIPDVKNELNAAENKLNYYRQQNSSVDLTMEAKSLLDTMVQLDAQINQLTFSEAEVSKLYTKEHPTYRALLEKRKTLEEEKNNLKKKINNLPETQQEVLRLTRDVQVGQDVYLQLLNKEQELSITKASTVGNVRIIDNAVTQPDPIKPKKLLVIVVLTVFGTMLSLMYVIVKVAFHKGVQSAEQLEENGLNVYASIPLSDWQLKNVNNSRKKDKKKFDVLIKENGADLAIEAIRGLRTRLYFAMLEAKNNILMISGPSPEIGKTFVSTNLAGVVAQAGQKVLLIDADMRRGYMHHYFGGLPNNGLSEILTGRVDYEKAVVHTDIAGLDYIGRGEIPPNPAELLMGSRIEKFLEWASGKYDLVLVDTPPILAVTDAAIIGRHVGTTLLVARFEKNTVKEIDVAKNRLEHSGVIVKGVILNAVTRKASNKYGEYAYYEYEYKSKE